MSQDDPFDFPVDETPRRGAGRGSRSLKGIWLWGGVAAAGGVLAVAVMLSSGQAPPVQPQREAKQATEPQVATGDAVKADGPPNVPAILEAHAQESGDAADATGTTVEVVDDPTGTLLWASPTAGPPILLTYVPNGAQCLIYLRPAQIAAHADGERLLAALGPWGRRQVERVEALAGGEWRSIDALLVSITVSDAHQLEATLRIELAAPIDEQELARRLPRAQPRGAGEGTMFAVDDRVYFLIPGQRPAVVCAPATLAEELIESAGDDPLLVRDVEALAAHSDADREATVIVAPTFLQASGSELLTAEGEPLDDALRWLLGNEATAIMLSADVGENFFAELRATPTLNVPPQRLAARLRQRIGEIPAAVENKVVAQTWHPHGRQVISRLPGMLRMLARYTRGGAEDQQAVVRVYLPAAAGHNLVMASELLLTQPNGEDASPEAEESVPAAPVTIARKLAQRRSLVFAKESLEEALRLLGEDLGVTIEIAGGDLQLEGITKNQSLGLELRDRPAGELLLEILLRANPDRQTGPADPRQKLVYVVEETTGGAAGRIIVTTRTAAEKRGERLPAAFLSQPR